MKKVFKYKNVTFGLGGYTPRNNEFERGAKYQLFVLRLDPSGCEYWAPFGAIFQTIKAAREYVINNYYMFV